MAVKFPQYDNERSGGSDNWDNDLAGQILLEDYFETPPSVTPVARVGSTGGVFQDTNHSSISFSVTITAGTDFAVVNVLNTYFTTVPSISSVTLDGVGCTLIAGTDTGSLSINGANNRIAAYGLVNPNVGTYNCVVTYASTVGFSSIAVQGYENVDTTTPTEGGFQAGANAAAAGVKTIAPTTTTANGDYLVSSFITTDVGGGLADLSNDGTDIREDWDSASNGTLYSTADKALTGSGQDFDWTNSEFRDWTGIAYVIKAASGGGGGSTTVVGKNGIKGSTSYTAGTSNGNTSVAGRVGVKGNTSATKSAITSATGKHGVKGASASTKSASSEGVSKLGVKGLTTSRKNSATTGISRVGLSGATTFTSGNINKSTSVAGRSGVKGSTSFTSGNVQTILTGTFKFKPSQRIRNAVANSYARQEYIDDDVEIVKPKISYEPIKEFSFKAEPFVSEFFTKLKDSNSLFEKTMQRIAKNGEAIKAKEALKQLEIAQKQQDEEDEAVLMLMFDMF